MAVSTWKYREKRTFEDKLLLKYWRKVGGLIFTEVLVGRGGTRQWGPGAKPRRIDAVRIIPSPDTPLPSKIIRFRRGNMQEFQELLTGAAVEVIEVKRHLNRVVLGQVIVGADLLELEYAPFQIKQVAVCQVGDPVLEWVCQRRGIEVWRP